MIVIYKTQIPLHTSYKYTYNYIYIYDIYIIIQRNMFQATVYNYIICNSRMLIT